MPVTVLLVIRYTKGPSKDQLRPSVDSQSTRLTDRKPSGLSRRLPFDQMMFDISKRMPNPMWGKAPVYQMVNRR